MKLILIPEFEFQLKYVKCIWYHIILQSGGGLMAKTLVRNQKDQGSIPFINIYYVEYVYLYIYFVYLCKCIVFRWVVDR
jgi:hypothetical protein